MPLSAFLAAVFFSKAQGNILVTRIFSFERARCGYINLITIISRVFGVMRALPGLKIVAI
jgi:hypothetical protein